MIKQQPRSSTHWQRRDPHHLLPILMIMNYFSSCIIIDRVSQGVVASQDAFRFSFSAGK